MTDHEIKKPTLFISHAASDAEFANAVKQEIEKVLANGVNVFCTSSPGAILVGKDWLSDIGEKLAVAQAIVAIVTPVSIERPWLWFEVGATWAKGRAGECRIYPLCTAEIELANLPPPLDRLQALSMGKAADLKLLFEALITQFGFGKIASFRASNITARIPRYKDVKVVETDLNEKAFRLSIPVATLATATMSSSLSDDRLPKRLSRRRPGSTAALSWTTTRPPGPKPGGRMSAPWTWTRSTSRPSSISGTSITE